MTVPAGAGTLGGPVLTVAAQKSIEAETSAEILTAFTAFSSACQDHKVAIKAAVKAEAEFVGLLFDIVAGFAAPAFATFAAGRLLGRLAGKITGLTSKPLGGGVIDVVDASGKVLRTEELITKGDVLKGAFTAVTKTSVNQIKQHATALFGETDDDKFLDALLTQFQSQAVTLAGKVPNMSLTELIATWYAYDTAHANVSTYKSAIKPLVDKFQAQVDPIGPDFSGRGILVIIEGGGLAVVKNARVAIDTMTYDFVTWVEPRMRPLALAKYDEFVKAHKAPPLRTISDIEVRGLPTD